jgi:hypothetical protein
VAAIWLIFAAARGKTAIELGVKVMKKVTFNIAVLAVLGVGLLILPPNEVAAQTWKTVAIQYQDKKDEGILAAEYKIVRLKRGCNLTIRLTNKTDRNLEHYWFKFNFKEGHEHENQMTNHLLGKSEELTYQSCGVPRIHISEVE